MENRLAPEQFDTLADIPEPGEHPRLFGHEEETTGLVRAYRAGRLHHGLLLAGPRGIGKATLAFRLVHHLLAHPDADTAPSLLGEPDPGSPLFRMIASGAHPSVLHLSRPLNEKTRTFRGVITIEEIRRISRFLSMTSHDDSYRIVIIDPAEDMNVNAANALLKNLEEPPRRTVFMLVTHAPGRLLPTIRSRTRLVRLQPLGEADMAAALECVDVEPSAPLLAAAAGSVREAILLSRHGGLEISQAIEQVLSAGGFDFARASKLADSVAQRDRVVEFDLFNRFLLESLAGLGRSHALRGANAAAARVAALWSDAQRSIGETLAYNLDRRQHVLGLLHRLHTGTHD